jgi:putative component of membrane protein insertase Oxa1/YidC/SpoIIIJ protein YidD
MRKWPDAPKPQCGESNRHTVGRLRGYLTTTLKGMRARDWFGTPRQVMLRFITAYQVHSSVGQARCGRGEGRSCSTLGYRYVNRYGAAQGILLAAWVVLTCGTVECFDNSDAGDCCGRR